MKFTASKDVEANENGNELYGYSDANWTGGVDTRRSTLGYVLKVPNCIVSWCSKKQESVTKSTTEAEYVALSQATQQAIWMTRLLSDTVLAAKMKNQQQYTKITKVLLKFLRMLDFITGQST